MTTYIAKDVHETLDYAFVRNVAEKIISVTYFQPADATMIVESCDINSQPLETTTGQSYPVGTSIVIWVRGGELNKSEKLRIQYETEGGRVLDEDLVFRFVEAG